MNVVRVLLVSIAFGAVVAAPAGAQVTTAGSAPLRPAVAVVHRTSTTIADEPTSTTAAPADDDGGVSLRGPWTAVSAVLAVVVLLVLARRRLREREREL